MWPRPRGSHPRQRNLHAEDHAEDVDVEDPLSGRVVLVDERADRHDPGVVDQDVHRTELLFGCVQELGERGPVGHVERQPHGAVAELGGGLLGRLQVDVADRHPHALAQERLRGGATDATRAAGDRGGLSGEDTGLLGHESPPGGARRMQG